MILRYIFLEYSVPSHAHEAVKNADGYKLDKQHTFRVNLFTDFDKYAPFHYRFLRSSRTMLLVFPSGTFLMIDDKPHVQ